MFLGKFFFSFRLIFYFLVEIKVVNCSLLVYKVNQCRKNCSEKILDNYLCKNKNGSKRAMFFILEKMLQNTHTSSSVVIKIN